MISIQRCYNTSDLAVIADHLGWHRLALDQADVERNLYITASVGGEIKALFLFIELKPNILDVHIGKTDLKPSLMKLAGYEVMRYLKENTSYTHILGLIKKTNRAACIFAHKMNFKKTADLGEYTMFAGVI